MSSKNTEYMKGRSESDSPRRRTSRGGVDSEFVNLEVDAAHKQELRGYCTDVLDLDAAIGGVLSDGNKITIKYDDRNRCFVAFGFAPDYSENTGFILTGRASSVSRALRELAYKHHVLLGGDWPSYHNISGSADDSDW